MKRDGEKAGNNYNIGKEEREGQKRCELVNTK